MIYSKIKRCLDSIISLLAIIVLSPFYLILAVIILFDSGKPVVFKQKRFGIKKTVFDIYKFRTMRLDTAPDVPTHELSNPEEYITKFGKFLRRTSLDELPQLFNILKGDMALVGPRPVLFVQHHLIAERDKYGANDIRPGLTGWAQVNGRDELTDDVKASLDGEYVRKMSFLFDVKCLLLTVKNVVKAEGVIEGGPDRKK